MTDWVQRYHESQRGQKGGPGSGYHGHAGRPGQVGGSAAGSGGGSGDVDDVTWAEGIIATRRLGGQVPQKAVNRAERILSQAGLKPSERKAPKRFDDIAKFYEKTKPVVGDTWTRGNINIEVAKLYGVPSGNLAADLWVVTPQKGYSKTLYIDNDWGYEIPPGR